MTYCTAQDLDNSDVNSGAGWAQGRFFYGNNIWASNRNIYVGHSTTTDLSVRPGFWNQNSGEQILFEGGDGRLGATVSSGAADTITLNGVTNPVYGDGRYMARRFDQPHNALGIVQARGSVFRVIIPVQGVADGIQVRRAGQAQRLDLAHLIDEPVVIAAGDIQHMKSA